MDARRLTRDEAQDLIHRFRPDKRPDDAARTAEINYQRIVETAQEGIWTIDAAYLTTFVNSRMAELLGYQTDEMIGVSLFEFMDEAARPAAAVEVGRHRDGLRGQRDFTFRRKDGSRIDTQVTASPIFDAHGVYAGALAMVSDISDRKRMEASLRQSEAELIEAQRVAGLGSFVLTLGTGVMHWSDGLRRLLRVHRDQPTPRFEEMPNWLSAASWDQSKRVIAETIRTGSSYELDVEIVCGDGSRRWATARGEAVRGIDGSVVAVRGTVHDIDARKRAEAAIAEQQLFNDVLIESLPGLFYVIAQNGRFLRWSRSLEVASGCSADEISHTTVFDLFNEPEKSLIGQRLQRVFSDGAAEVEGHLVNRNGAATPYLFSGRRGLFNGELCLIGLGVDISARVEAERDLMEREKRYLRQRDALIELTKSDALSNGDLATALTQITEVGARTLGVARVSIWRYCRENTAIRCSDLYELESNRHSAGAELLASAYPSYFRSLPEMSVLVADDARHDPRTSEFTETYLIPAGITSMLDAPIVVQGQVDGVLCHEHVGSPRQWTADESAFAVAVANLVSLVVEGWERRRTEESLRNSETKHRVLFEESPDANLLMDDHQFLACNAATLALFGYASEAEFVKLQPAEVSPPVQSDGTPSRAATNQRIADALSNGKNRFEWLHRRKSGEIFPADVCLTALTVSGRRLLLVTIRDMTTRERAAADLRLQSAALNAAANAIAITNRQGLLVWVNPAFCALTGYSQEEVVGKNPNLLKSNRHDAPFYQRLWKTILAGNVWHGEITNRRKDGRLYPEEMTITPVKNAAGEITHFIAIKRDLTEQRQMEAQFRQAQRLEAVGTLAGGIAHDFNNILGAMLGCTELAAMDCEGNEAVLNSLAQVTMAGQRGSKLVRQMLAFSGRQLQPRVPLLLGAVVEEAVGLLRSALPSSLQLRSRLDPAAPPVLADATEIHQIVMNLGINAWHAMNDRPGTIDINLDVVDAERDGRDDSCRYVRLTVADNGEGMTPETQARIFDPFFTTKGPDKGTGLGLATVHGIMNSCRGEISVTSSVGRGTTFRLLFPVIATPVGPAHSIQEQSYLADPAPAWEQ